MQTALCPECKAKDLKIKCSKNHLEKYHGLRIDTAQETITEIKEIIKRETENEDKDKKRGKSRQAKLEIAELFILSKIDILHKFFNATTQKCGQ